MTAPFPSRSRCRVLHVIQNLNYGGMERVLTDIVRLADPARVESHVLVLQYFGRFAQGLEPHATLHKADPMSRWSWLWPGPLIRVMRAIHPDVVHSHSGVWYKAALAARYAGVSRVIHTEHGLRARDTWLSRLVERRAARHSDVVVAVSDSLACLLRDGIAPSDAVVVVTNGVNTDLFRPRPDSGRLRRELGLSPLVPIVGSIGRLEPVKGYDVMLAAFTLLRAAWCVGEPPALVVVGDGSERERLAARGILPGVFLLGWRDDLADVHSAFTLFTLASHSEGTSIGLLEAMSAGLCPIVTDVGGNAAVLGPKLRHRLVPAGDPQALADAWRAALEDPVGRAGDAATARDQVERDFSAREMVRRYENLYMMGRKGEMAPPISDPPRVRTPTGSRVLR
jgi:glycosyltransferase involved in cell wall biosynthesis